MGSGIHHDMVAYSEFESLPSGLSERSNFSYGESVSYSTEDSNYSSDKNYSPGIASHTPVRAVQWMESKEPSEHFPSSSQQTSPPFSSSGAWITVNSRFDRISETAVNVIKSVKNKLGFFDINTKSKRVPYKLQTNKASLSSQQHSSTENDFLNRSLKKSKGKKNTIKTFGQLQHKKQYMLKGKLFDKRSSSSYDIQKKKKLLELKKKHHQSNEKKSAEVSKRREKDDHVIKTPKRYSSLDVNDSFILHKYLYGLPEDPEDVKDARNRPATSKKDSETNSQGYETESILDPETENEDDVLNNKKKQKYTLMVSRKVTKRTDEQFKNCNDTPRKEKVVDSVLSNENQDDSGERDSDSEERSMKTEESAREMKDQNKLRNIEEFSQKEISTSGWQTSSSDKSAQGEEKCILHSVSSQTETGKSGVDEVKVKTKVVGVTTKIEEGPQHTRKESLIRKKTTGSRKGIKESDKTVTKREGSGAKQINMKGIGFESNQNEEGKKRKIAASKKMAKDNSSFIKKESIKLSGKEAISLDGRREYPSKRIKEKKEKILDPVSYNEEQANSNTSSSVIDEVLVDVKTKGSETRIRIKDEFREIEKGFAHEESTASVREIKDVKKKPPNSFSDDTKEVSRETIYSDIDEVQVFTEVSTRRKQATEIREKSPELRQKDKVLSSLRVRVSDNRELEKKMSDTVSSDRQFCVEIRGSDSDEVEIKTIVNATRMNTPDKSRETRKEHTKHPQKIPSEPDGQIKYSNKRDKDDELFHSTSFEETQVNREILRSSPSDTKRETNVHSPKSHESDYSVPTDVTNNKEPKNYNQGRTDNRHELNLGMTGTSRPFQEDVLSVPLTGTFFTGMINTPSIETEKSLKTIPLNKLSAVPQYARKSFKEPSKFKLMRDLIFEEFSEQQIRINRKKNLRNEFIDYLKKRNIEEQEKGILSQCAHSSGSKIQSDQERKQDIKKKIKANEDYFLLRKPLGAVQGINVSSPIAQENYSFESKKQLFRDTANLADVKPAKPLKSTEKLKEGTLLKTNMSRDYFLPLKYPLSGHYVEKDRTLSTADGYSEERKSQESDDSPGSNKSNYSSIRQKIKRDLNDSYFLFHKRPLKRIDLISYEDIGTTPLETSLKASTQVGQLKPKVLSFFKAVYDEQRKKLVEEFNQYIMHGRSINYDNIHRLDTISVSDSREFFKEIYQERKRHLDKELIQYIENRAGVTFSEKGAIFSKFLDKEKQLPYKKRQFDLERDGELKTMFHEIKSTEKEEKMKDDFKKPVCRNGFIRGTETKMVAGSSHKISHEDICPDLKETVRKTKFENDTELIFLKADIKDGINKPKTQVTVNDFAAIDEININKKMDVKKSKQEFARVTHLATKRGEIMEPPSTVDEQSQQIQQKEILPQQVKKVTMDLETFYDNKSPETCFKTKDGTSVLRGIFYSTAIAEGRTNKGFISEGNKLSLPVPQSPERIEINHEKKCIYKIDGKKYLYFARISIPWDQKSRYSTSKKSALADDSTSSSMLPSRVSTDISATANVSEKQYEIFRVDKICPTDGVIDSSHIPETITIQDSDEFIESTDVSVVDHSYKFERGYRFSTANLISHITKEARGLEYMCTITEPLIKLSENVYISPTETSFGKRVQNIIPDIKDNPHDDPFLEDVKNQLIDGLQKLLGTAPPALCDLEQAEEQQCSEFYGVCSPDIKRKQSHTQLESIMKTSTFHVNARENVLTTSREFLFVWPTTESIRHLEIVDENLDMVTTSFRNSLNKLILISADNFQYQVDSEQEYISTPAYSSRYLYEKKSFMPSFKKDANIENEPEFCPVYLSDARYSTGSRSYWRHYPIPSEDVKTNESSEASSESNESESRQKYNVLRKTLPSPKLETGFPYPSSESEVLPHKIPLPDSYYGTGNESEIMSRLISPGGTKVNTRPKKLGISDKTKKVFNICEGTQKYHTLKKNLPPPKQKTNATGLELQDKVKQSSYENENIPQRIPLPDAYYGTESTNSITRTPYLISSETDKIFKEAKKLVTPDQISTPLDISKRRQKYQNVKKTLPPSENIEFGMDLEDEALQNADNIPHQILLPDAYYGTYSQSDFTHPAISLKISQIDANTKKLNESGKMREPFKISENKKKCSMLKKFIPPPKQGIPSSDMDLKENIPQSDEIPHRISLSDAYYGTRSKSSLLPLLLSDETKGNDLRRKNIDALEKTKVTSSPFECRQKYHILKKTLPPSSYSKFIATDMDLPFDYDISISDAYFGIGSGSHSMPIRSEKDALYDKVRELDVSSKVCAIVTKWEEQKYHTLTKTLPPYIQEPVITVADMDLKNIPLECASNFILDTKFSSLNSMNYVRPRPSKVLELKQNDDFKICMTQAKFEPHQEIPQPQGLDFDQDIEDMLHQIYSLFLENPEEIQTSDRRTVNLKKIPTQIIIPEDLLTALNSVNDCVRGEMIRKHDENNQLVPIIDPSFRNRVWDLTNISQDLTVSVQATNTDPLTLKISHPSNPKTTIEMNLVEFLRHRFHQSIENHASEHLSVGIIDWKHPNAFETAMGPTRPYQNDINLRAPCSEDETKQAANTDVYLRDFKGLEYLGLRNIQQENDFMKKDLHLTQQIKGNVLDWEVSSISPQDVSIKASLKIEVQDIDNKSNSNELEEWDDSKTKDIHGENLTSESNETSVSRRRKFEESETKQKLHIESKNYDKGQETPWLVIASKMDIQVVRSSSDSESFVSENEDERDTELSISEETRRKEVIQKENQNAEENQSPEILEKFQDYRSLVEKQSEEAEAEDLPGNDEDDYRRETPKVEMAVEDASFLVPSTSFAEEQETHNEIAKNPSHRRRLNLSGILNVINDEIHRIEHFYANRSIFKRNKRDKKRLKTERKTEKSIFIKDSIQDKTIVTAESDSDEESD
ncbi:uncharacterized protein NPIL_474631 [Nephila pilipes]|uniref:Uncharacterized protein n=1 Tax=Nephila pilipes TaxID=299642 RepID=A0A8X6TBK8_NEPPI|nr:uncharacterized protein NPIL_474631 [Nephila pilipes]